MSERPVEKSLYRNYIRKAVEMLEEAKHAKENSRNNAAVVASIHQLFALFENTFDIFED